MNTLIKASQSILIQQIIKKTQGIIVGALLHKAKFFSTSRSSVCEPPQFRSFYDYLKHVHTTLNESCTNQKHPNWPPLLLEAFGNKHAISKLNLDTVVSGIDELNRKFNDLDEIGQLMADALKETDLKEREDLLVIVEDEKQGIETQINQCDDSIIKNLAEIILGDQLVTSCILEVSSGVGGQEAMLFASDLFQMYKSLCVNQCQDFEYIEYDRSELSGVHKATALIRFNDKGFHGLLKQESGIHRVQRVPLTERTGRVHTSTASVVLLPVTDSCVTIEEKDFEITTVKKSKGSGGQHANKTESGVRIKHLLTGLTVTCNATRSQHENKERALNIITAKLAQIETVAHDSEIARIRKQQVKQRERSDKIRTYNFSQDRVTDHRTFINSAYLDVSNMTEENNVSSNLEVQFAQRLASNEKKIRDRAVKKLRQFLTLRSMKTDGGFQRDEMLKIWKGLFYCMWMSDKPLVQEELARTIAELMIEVKNIKTAMLFYETSLTTLMREWKGIDRLRMDKFYLLARCVLKRGFEFLKLQEWDSELIDWILSILKSGPINHTGPVTGMHYHICDIYLEELSKVGHDCLTSEQVAKFLDPYCILFSKTKNQYLANRIRENIFQELIETSNVALETLKQQGESLLIGIRQNSIDTESTSTLRVDYGGLADRLFNLVSAKDTLSKNRKKTYGVVKQFRELAEGRLPMDNIPDLEESSDDELKKEEDRLVEKLCAENSEETRKKQKRLRGKKRKKELLRAMKMSENIEDDDMNPEHFEDTEIPHDNGDLSNKITSEQDIQDKVAGGERTDSKRQKKEVNMIIMGSNLIAEDKNDMEYSPADESFENWHEKKIKHTAPSKKIRTHDSAPHTATKKRKASNIPDLLQDVPVCKMSRKVAKRKSELLRKRHLLNELMTSERQQESTKKDGKQKPKKTFKEELSLQDTNNNFINDLINNKCNTRKLGIMNEFMTINSIDTPAKTATFFKVAASKVEKLQEKKHQIAVKKKVTQVEPHTPKRVCFEMSKTMVQPFRKNEKSKAVSQSPNCIVFDPRKKPDFGLLKTRTMQTPENSKKRATADDFF